MNKVKGKALKTYIKVTNEVKGRVRAVLNNERGSYPIVAIIFSAIVVVAVLACDTTVKDTFSGSVSKFKTFMDNKLTELFS